MLKPFRVVYLLSFFVVLCPIVFSQTRSLPETPVQPLYTFRQSWSLFSEYSPDSSHIFLGISEQRRFFNIGGAFVQRLLLRRYVGLSYMAEVKPLILESDPVLKEAMVTLTSPRGTVRYDQKFMPAIPVIAVTPDVVTNSITQGGATYT